MAIGNIYLTAGMRENLFSLQKTGSLMEVTQNRLSTGLRVNSALDDPISFFAAQQHRERAGDLALLKDAMNEAIQTVKAANTGVEGIIDLIAQMKALITAGRTSEDFAALETRYDDIADQIGTMALDASYKGTNLLDAATTVTPSMTVEFSSNGDLDITGLNVSDIAFTAADFDPLTDPAIFDDLVDELDGFLAQFRSTAQTLSSNLSVVTARLDFTNNMINTLNTGADNLTLADMNEESANMLMLQTRQALATSSLGMASDAAQAVLRLF